jgi:SAM-dependent methyltransferase
MNNDYIDFLAHFGIGGAHPGGFPLTKRLFDSFDIPSSASILDIGCGTGQTAAFLWEKYGCKVTAVDKHPLMVEKAKNRIKKNDSNIQVVTGDAQQLEFSTDSFDFIVSESVISFNDIPKTSHELSRVLKDGGQLLAIEMTTNQPLTDELKNQIEQLYGISKVFNQEEWVEEFMQAGFHTVTLLEAPSDLEITELNDLQPSENLNEKWYDIWDDHTLLMAQANMPLSYRIFLCEK